MSETRKESLKCLCETCPNYQKCLSMLKQIGIDEHELKMIRKATDMDEPVSYGVLGFYFLAKGLLKGMEPKKKKWRLHL